ncbi:DNA cytosine methyltransferase [Photobacterium toruni]|uniref:DNA (cytosine-5-)-methyltransferase n=1 Tax=Photobacterium toruni TaxID=1935446 RepID=A0ABU6L5U3_9GAMM|nr:DNA cytosine methyltransferase [Photobacterium toruni]
MILPGEIVVDNFAGGGGASTGMELGLNRHVDIAINHDPAAIDMHRINHPETKHYCESVWDVDPIEACEGRPVGLAWFSPDCKHFSKAKGNRPVDKNIRGLAWVAIRWAALVPVRMIMLENVEEFMTWGPVVEIEENKFKPCPNRKGETFNAFVKVLTVGLEDTHPAWPEIRMALGDSFQHYDKLKAGLGYKLDFKVLHACDYGAPTTRKRFFLIARSDNEEIKWPAKTHGAKGSGLKSFNTAASIIDWSIPVKSIFDRKKPLAEKTLLRINKGLDKFVFGVDEPFIVPNDCVVPFANELLNPISADLITSHIVKLRGTNIGHGTNEPVHTISAGGFHIGEVRAFLIKYYGMSYGENCNKPIGTVTTKDRFGLVTVKGENYKVVDIGMRMLEPHELFAAQGFPSDYQISHNSCGKKLSKASQVARCGNAVCPPVAQALIEANIKQSESAIAA